MPGSSLGAIVRGAAMPRYQQLKDLLILRIQGLGPGDRMPSIRELIGQTGLAHHTVVKALTELEVEGYVDLLPGKGAFVSRRARSEHHGVEQGTGTVVLATPEWDDHNIWSINHQAMEQAVRSGRRLVSWRFWPGARLEELVPFARSQPELAGLIILPPSEALSASDTAQFDALAVPVVFLHPSPAGGDRIHSVASDPSEHGTMMARLLLERGHRRLAFVQHQPCSDITDLMIAGARQATADAGAALTVHEAGLASWGDALAAAAQIAPQAAADGSTGLIFTSATGAFAAVAVLRRIGHRVPEDLGVIGSADHPLLSYADPPIAATVDDYAACMTAAFAVIAGTSQGRITVPIRVIPRASLGPVRDP
jgi:DNA-binding LacI/PurR family transcriptional regulator